MVGRGNSIKKRRRYWDPFFLNTYFRSLTMECKRTTISHVRLIVCGFVVGTRYFFCSLRNFHCSLYIFFFFVFVAFIWFGLKIFTFPFYNVGCFSLCLFIVKITRFGILFIILVPASIVLYILLIYFIISNGCIGPLSMICKKATRNEEKLFRLWIGFSMLCICHFWDDG